MPEDHDEIITLVRDLIDPLVMEADLELVDIEYLGGRGRYILRILIDKPSRVTLGECAMINRQVSGIVLAPLDDVENATS